MRRRRRRRSRRRPRRPKPKVKVYVVKPGDTVSEIASKHGTTVDELLELNPTMSSTTVNPGDRIKLPQD